MLLPDLGKVFQKPAELGANQSSQVAKNTAGLVRAVLTIASRPSSDQTSARSLQNAWLKTVRLPTGRPFGFPD